MAQTIKLKRSAVAAKVPLTTDIALGELAINTYDGKMYFKKNVSGTETIIELANVGHVHAASDITSGTISTARLGSGTANNTTFLRGDNTWATVSGSGTVTSVAFSTGTTGFTVTGSPITSSGTITLAGTLAVANGGTGATSAATALTNLGAAADSAVVKLTGTQSVAGAKTFSDITTVSNTTQSTTTSNGALVVSGGLGVAKTLRSAEDAYFNGVRIGRGGANNSSNLCVGNTSMITTNHGGNTVAFGNGALGSISLTGGNNTAIGNNASLQNSSGGVNTTIGLGALQENNTGSANIAIGWDSGNKHANGTSNLIDPEGCVYIGAECRGQDNSDSNSVVIAGRTATARGVGEGANTTVLGNTETTKTTLFGKWHQKSIGTNNLIIGNENTGLYLTSSNSNIFALGANNLRANLLQGNNNIAIGTEAMMWAGAASSPGTDNVALGYSALSFATTGQRNLAIGTVALAAATSGSSNVGVGFYSLQSLTTGGDNVGIGSQAGSALSTGGANVCIGALSLGATNGSSNVAIGNHAGWRQTDGSTDATGLSNCVFIGSAARSNGNNQSNQIVIGDTALGEGSNTTVIGKAATTSTKLFGKTTSQTNTATTNAVVHGLRTEHQSTGTPATGIGTGIEFAAETAANNTEVGATIEAITTDVTAGSEDFDLVFKTMANGAAATENLRITSAGNIVLNSAGKSIQNLAAPTNDNDAARKKYVDDQVAALVVKPISTKITSSGTWTSPSNVSYIRVCISGGGGGGGAASATGIRGGNGGKGGYQQYLFQIPTTSASYSVTIGAGGAGSNTGNGSAGTSTVFFGITATGGAGGSANVGSIPPDGSNGTVTVGTLPTGVTLLDTLSWDTRKYSAGGQQGIGEIGQSGNNATSGGAGGVVIDYYEIL